MIKLIIQSAHPAPYHAPVFRRISELLSEQGHDCTVIYFSDFSLRNFYEPAFAITFAWDEPLLDGYRSIILQEDRKQSMNQFWHYKAKGFGEILEKEKPTHFLFTNPYSIGAFKMAFMAKIRGVKNLLRTETSDEAILRPFPKNLFRKICYQFFYKLFDGGIAIGRNNLSHMLRHGFQKNQVTTAFYTVPDRTGVMSSVEKSLLRKQCRESLGLSPDKKLIMFCGKLHEKKNPDLILDAAELCSEEEKRRMAVLLVGSGELEAELKRKSEKLEFPVYFAGFKNQKELPPYYLAADVFVLPSRRMGETWGLVVNEALNAGLPSIVSDAVGCGPDFSRFPDFQTFPSENVAALCSCLKMAVNIPRNFERYSDLMKDFSEEVTSRKIVSAILEF